jgi:hypothetical protein
VLVGAEMRTSWAENQMRPASRLGWSQQKRLAGVHLPVLHRVHRNHHDPRPGGSSTTLGLSRALWSGTLRSRHGAISPRAIASKIPVWSAKSTTSFPPGRGWPELAEPGRFEHQNSSLLQCCDQATNSNSDRIRRTTVVGSASSNLPWCSEDRARGARVRDAQ